MRKKKSVFLMSCFFLFGIVFLSYWGYAQEGLEKILNPETGNVFFVSIKTGNNSNPGTKDQPLKNIDKAIKKAATGDTIAVAEGIYSGTFGVGYLESAIPLKLYGSFNNDFSARDIRAFPTLIQPDNKSGAKARKSLLTFTREVNGVVVNGFVFNMGERNSYSPSEGKPEGVETGMLLLPPQKASGQNPTVTESCISIPSAAQGGNVLIQNNIFVNAAKFAIQAGLREGKISILNNVFVANRMAAIEIYGTCRNTGGPKDLSLCGEAEIAYNTILFSWSRIKDFLDMGYGVRVMTKLDYNIHHNIIGGNIMSGIDHSRFNKDEWVKIDHNIFFVNKNHDLDYRPDSNVKLNIDAGEFGDLEIASAQGNKNEIPAGLAVDKAYLEGFLSARYTEEADYNPDSPANQWREMLGLNKQGKLTTTVSMFANRYPWKKALDLFGSVKDAGAQKMK
ncbi:MAG: right-handed parallel beta-helix repeat-containing protein [Candidatus Aminicenantes bacterium]|nr:right-handed parallel beta-helix repeat-containing protein [Candidatus Aminicenantes bacterium]